MATAGFGIAVTSGEGAVTVVLSGRFYCGVSGSLLGEAVARSIERTTRAVIIDLSATERVDASVLGILAFFYAVALSSGVRVTVENGSPLIQEMFRITGLSTFFQPTGVRAPKAAQ